MKWIDAPIWTNYKLALQGGTTIWSEESPSEILF